METSGRARLSQDEFETFIQSRGWQILRDEIALRLKTAEGKLKQAAQHPANYPTVNEFAVAISAHGALCQSYEILLRLPAEMLERTPKGVEQARAREERNV